MNDPHAHRMNHSFKLVKTTLGALALLAASMAHADAVGTLREFVRDAKTGTALFSQTVISPDGAKKKTSSGNFEFSRPNRFRFMYTKPFEQAIVADGQKVWIYDADLNQASSRKMTQALGATPAALLAGGNLEKDFELKALPDRDGLSWVQALPKIKESGFESIQIGFKEKTLAAINIVDSFGQRSNLLFSELVTNGTVNPEHFRFTPPKGADVIEQ
jgi:outer membrane lipoprotein carrier protein